MRLAALLVLTGCWRSEQASPPPAPTLHVGPVATPASAPAAAPPEEPRALDTDEGVEEGVARGVVVGGPGRMGPRPSTATASRLEAHRLTGHYNVPPPASVMDAALKDGKAKLVSTFRVCIDVQGLVSEARLLKSSGYPAYDTLIRTEIVAWTFQPLLENGQAVPLCTAYTFIVKV